MEYTGMKQETQRIRSHANWQHNLTTAHTLAGSHPCIFCTNQQHSHHLWAQGWSYNWLQQLETLGCHFQLEPCLEPFAEKQSHSFQDVLEVWMRLSILYMYILSSKWLCMQRRLHLQNVDQTKSVLAQEPQENQTKLTVLSPTEVLLPRVRYATLNYVYSTPKYLYRFQHFLSSQTDNNIMDCPFGYAMQLPQ